MSTTKGVIFGNIYELCYLNTYNCVIIQVLFVYSVYNCVSFFFMDEEKDIDHIKDSITITACKDVVRQPITLESHELKALIQFEKGREVMETTVRWKVMDGKDSTQLKSHGILGNVVERVLTTKKRESIDTTFDFVHFTEELSEYLDIESKDVNIHSNLISKCPFLQMMLFDEDDLDMFQVKDRILYTIEKDTCEEDIHFLNVSPASLFIMNMFSNFSIKVKLPTIPKPLEDKIMDTWDLFWCNFFYIVYDHGLLPILIQDAHFIGYQQLYSMLLAFTSEHIRKLNCTQSAQFLGMKVDEDMIGKAEWCLSDVV